MCITLHGISIHFLEVCVFVFVCVCVCVCVCVWYIGIELLLLLHYKSMRYNSAINQ